MTELCRSGPGHGIPKRSHSCRSVDIMLRSFNKTYQSLWRSVLDLFRNSEQLQLLPKSGSSSTWLAPSYTPGGKNSSIPLRVSEVVILRTVTLWQVDGKSRGNLLKQDFSIFKVFPGGYCTIIAWKRMENEQIILNQ